MRRRALQWVNSSVLNEAIQRYEQGILPRSMTLWVEKLLDLKPGENSELFSHNQ